MDDRQSSSKNVALIASQAYSLTNFRGPLMRAMLKRGCTIYAFAPDHDEQSRSRLQEIGAIPVDYPLQRTGLNPVRDLLDAVKLAVILRRIGPQIVLSYFIKPVIYGSIAAWFAGIPRRFALVAGLGHAFADFGERATFRQKAVRLLVKTMLAAGFRACDGVIFQNEEDRDEFVASKILSKEKTIRTNGTGVDLNFHRQMAWPSGPMTFLLAARLLKPKGIAEFAEAARVVKSQRPDVHFILLGGLDSNPEGFLQSEVEALTSKAGIEWPGHVDDVLPYMQRSHVFVLPSYYREGVPRSIQEALASGRAVITTDNVGCRETVVSGKNGFLVPIKDVDALAKAMLTLVDDERLAEEFGRESRKIAERKFDVAQVNDQIVAFIGV